ncbi:MAG: PAS domain-containing protein [Chitinivibrionales bacterium]|nr:PAS domain-containing protein [Chitinivibrionales bacterium]
MKKATRPGTKKNKPVAARAAVPILTENSGRFPIIGIGASAGGLEALNQFLGNVPDDSGMAFVIIQHLDPTHKGMMPQLLQRSTTLSVVEVKNRTKIKPNHVYVIPPNKSMSILKGVLHLFEPQEKRGLRLPIDFFFSSLAEDMGEASIAVILSGMGTDGSRGIKAIKEKAGIVLVQEPQTAKFNGMPCSAIDSVVADIIAPAHELPGKLILYLSNATRISSGPPLRSSDQSSLEKIVILLRAGTGHDFSQYKKNTVYRRIERRMNVHQIHQIATYVRFLQENPAEVTILYKELLIGVTNFFRDEALWQRLEREIFPALIASRPHGSVLRAWVPACATGQEAYSLAIVFKEALEKTGSKKGISLQVFATDIDSTAIEEARKGSFKETIAAEVTNQRLNRFFTKSGSDYQINAEIREMIVFAPQNIIQHPPFTKLDILSCRNLLIYLESELQNKLVNLFYYSLNPGAVLVLGNAETIGTQSGMFTVIDAKLRLYRRTASSCAAEFIDFSPPFYRFTSNHQDRQKPVKATDNIQSVADQLLLQQFSPAAVFVNEKGDIVYIHGHTGKYLEPAVGKANWNIFAMVREDIRSKFCTAFRKAVQQPSIVTLSDVPLKTDGGTQAVTITIQQIEKPEALQGMVMVVFTEGAKIPAAKVSKEHTKKNSHDNRSVELEQELLATREELRSLREEMQASQEELKSTNEELQSTNEELQSTNEELVTSKEEMQSLNEELQTVNIELQSTVDDLSRASTDMKNLLNSTDIATLFLDNDLCIRRYTTPAIKIFKFNKNDIGRLFTDQVTDLIYPDIVADSQEVLRTLVFQEKAVTTHDNRWFNIRIMPYRTQDNHINGLVITFVDITAFKALEAELRKSSESMKILLESISDIFFLLDINLFVTYLNPVAQRMVKNSETVGKYLFDTLPEAKGTVFEDKCRLALKEKVAVSFEVYFETAPLHGWYDVRLYPLPGGVSVFLQLRKNV